MPSANSRSIQQEAYRTGLSPSAVARQKQLVFESRKNAGPITDNFVAWCAATLTLPTGIMAGSSFVPMRFQSDFILDALSEGVLTAGLSVSKRNGKSSLLDALALSFLDPQSPHWSPTGANRVGFISLGTAQAQSRILSVQQMAEKAEVYIQANKNPAPGRITDPVGNQVLYFPHTRLAGVGEGFNVVIADEVGRWKEKNRETMANLLAAVAAIEGRIIAISTQGESSLFRDFERWAKELPESHVWHCYRAPSLKFYEDTGKWEKPRLDDRDALREANPGHGRSVSLDGLVKAGKMALTSPAYQRTFRADHFNDDIDPDKNPVVERDVFIQASLDRNEEPPAREGRAFLGVDLGAQSSLSSAFCVWETGRCEILNGIAPKPTLRERERSDGVNVYQLAHELGELKLCGTNKVTDVEEFWGHVCEWLEGVQVKALGCDLFRKLEFEHILTAKRPNNCRVFWRRQGNGPDGRADLRAFQSYLHTGKIKLPFSYLLPEAFKAAEITYDANANPSLRRVESGGKSRIGRIDPLSAALPACGLMAEFGG